MTPKRFTARTHSKSSSGSSAMGSPRLPTPALLQTRWTSPKCSNAVAARAATSASMLTSVGTVSTSAPPRLSASLARCRTGRSMSASTSLMPSAAKRWAMASPMPDAPPVMTATLPSRSSMVTAWAPLQAQEVGGVEEVGIGLQLTGRPVVADPPALQHVGALGEPERDVGELLDEQHPDPRFGHRRQRRHQALDDQGGETQRQLVHDENRGLGH